MEVETTGVPGGVKSGGRVNTRPLVGEVLVEEPEDELEVGELGGSSTLTRGLIRCRGRAGGGISVLVIFSVEVWIGGWF